MDCTLSWCSRRCWCAQCCRHMMHMRAQAQTLRLALIYALLDGAREIDHVHIQAALAMRTYVRTSKEQISLLLHLVENGRPSSARRLQKLANTIATLTRMPRDAGHRWGKQWPTGRET